MKEICINNLMESNEYDEYLNFFIDYMNKNDVYVYENKQDEMPIGILKLKKHTDNKREYEFFWNYEKDYKTTKNENFFGVKFNRSVKLFVKFKYNIICNCI